MNQNKITLLIDQDDVLAEYIRGLLLAYNKKFSTTIQYDACISWDLHSIFGENVEEVMHEPDLFRSLEPVKDALLVFKRLFDSGLFDMYIVTAADPRCVEAKFEWIRRHLPFFPEDHVIICKKKYMIKGDYLLDDGMHNIEDFERNGGIPVIFERPHNKNKGDHLQRVTNWLSFERFIMNEYTKRMNEIS